MAIDWVDIASKLLASNNPVTAVAGAIKSTADVVHDFTKDDPAKEAKFWRDYNKKLTDYVTRVQEAKDGEDISGLIASYNDDFESK